MIIGELIVCHGSADRAAIRAWVVGLKHEHFVVLKHCMCAHSPDRVKRDDVRQGAGKRKGLDNICGSVCESEVEEYVSHIQAFACALSCVKNLDISVQQLACDLENELLCAVDSKVGFRRALDVELEVADCFLDPKWCVCETRLHYMRGVFPDLVLLALKFEISLCVKDEEGGLRLLVGEAREITLFVHSVSCYFGVSRPRVCDGSGKGTDIPETPECDWSAQVPTWREP
eukprot:2634894-Amphidinium_carterae.2